MNRAERTAARHRNAAAALIRCMDTRDQAAAEALAARLAHAGDLDTATAWVWRLEAERAARRRVYQASPAWRTIPDPAPSRLPGLDEVIAGIAAVIPLPPQRVRRPRGRPRGSGNLLPHGTPAAWKRHRVHGEYPCEACLPAEGNRKREERRRAA